MTKEEFIAKWGESKWLEKMNYRITKTSDYKQRTLDEADMCVTVDFNVPLPPKEEGMTRNEYKEYTLERGQELAYHFQRMIGFKWYREHSKNEQCIVIVEPKIFRGEYRFRTEFYVTKVLPSLKDWLMDTIKSLDYE